MRFCFVYTDNLEFWVQLHMHYISRYLFSGSIANVGFGKREVYKVIPVCCPLILDGIYTRYK